MYLGREAPQNSSSSKNWAVFRCSAFGGPCHPCGHSLSIGCQERWQTRPLVEQIRLALSCLAKQSWGGLSSFECVVVIFSENVYKITYAHTHTHSRVYAEKHLIYACICMYTTYCNVFLFACISFYTYIVLLGALDVQHSWDLQNMFSASNWLLDCQLKPTHRPFFRKRWRSWKEQERAFPRAVGGWVGGGGWAFGAPFHFH